MKQTLFAALFLTSALSVYAAPIPALTLVPAIASGYPGTVTGWGYDIVNNDPSDFLVLNDSVVMGSLSTGTFGTYVDYIASNFIVIAPDTDTGVVPFVLGSSGVGEFDIVKFVPPMQIPGSINIDYSLFSTNPNDPNTFDPSSFVDGGTVSATAGVDIAPEPASGALLLAGCMLLVPLGVRAARRKSAVRCNSMMLGRSVRE